MAGAINVVTEVLCLVNRTGWMYEWIFTAEFNRG